jgi:hypothetical protein
MPAYVTAHNREATAAQAQYKLTRTKTLCEGERVLLHFNHVIFTGECMMNSDIDKPADASKQLHTTGPRTTELHNDRTHDSTVDTDGKNLEAARIAGHSPISPDEITTSNATLINSVPEAHDGMAGFDSRVGGNHLLLALEPGYTVIDKGMVPPQGVESADDEFDDPRSIRSRRERGRIHYALNHLRPTRVIELHRAK